jgi:hypothetical protein
MLRVTHLVGCRATVRLTAIAVVIVLAACSQQLPPRSISTLVDDPAVLQGVLFRCNQLQNAALRDPECRNAREAVDRLAADEGIEQQGDKQAAADAGFEKARAARRARDARETKRQEVVTAGHVDPYTMPLVPEQPEVPLATIVVSAGALPDT